MSKIIAIADLENKNWEVNSYNFTYNYIDLYISFKPKNNNFVFENLQFKYELIQNKEIIDKTTYPPQGMRYISSNEEFMICKRLKNIKPDEEYKLKLWIHNKGKAFETTTEFKGVRPQKPYESWVWNDDNWQAPVVHPTGDKFYTWNEETLTWDEISSE